MSRRQFSRRSFLSCAGISASVGLAGSLRCISSTVPRGRPEGTVTGFEPIIIKVNDVGEGTWDLVRLSTDVGITGIGEASHSGRYPAKVEAMEEIFPLLRGLSPFEVERFRRRFMEKGPHRDGALTTAFSGMEQAMWDLAGKLTGLSVSRLLGGSLRRRIRAYANINRATRGDDRTPEGFAKNARKALSWGFTAIKMAPFDYLPHPRSRQVSLEELAGHGVDCISAVRDAIGPDVDLLIDVHSRFDVGFAISMARRLEPLDLFWMEEPVSSLNPREAGRISRAIELRTAGGEHLFGMKLFADHLKNGGWDVFMPDVKHCGGILEMRKIAAIAESGGHACAPHNPTGPVATAASVQCCASMPNFLILEYAWGETDWSCDLVRPREEFVDGCLVVHDTPGLGIELNMETVEAHRIKG